MRSLLRRSEDVLATHIAFEVALSEKFTVSTRVKPMVLDEKVTFVLADGSTELHGFQVPEALGVLEALLYPEGVKQAEKKLWETVTKQIEERKNHDDPLRPNDGGHKIHYVASAPRDPFLERKTFLNKVTAGEYLPDHSSANEYLEKDLNKAFRKEKDLNAWFFPNDKMNGHSLCEGNPLKKGKSCFTPVQVEGRDRSRYHNDYSVQSDLLCSGCSIFHRLRREDNCMAI